MRPVIVRALLALSLAIVPAGAAACGSDDGDAKAQRPPVPINVSVVVGQDGVTASPLKFGAGQVTLLVSNQSGASRTLIVEGPRLKRSVGPINPQDTATVRVTLPTGEYSLSAADTSGVKPAKLQVGPPRRSAQDQLTLP
jgi:hypothetical protein